MRPIKLPFPPKVTIIRLLQTVYGLTLDREIHLFYALAQKEASARGLKSMCLYLKALYTQAQMLSLGLPPEPIPFRKSDKKGFSKDLRPFKKLLLSDDPSHKRAGLTILRLGYLVFCDPDFSVKSITDPGEEKWGQFYHMVLFVNFCVHQVPPEEPYGNIEIIPRARAGPNGHSCLASSHLDAVALSQRPKLLARLQELADIIDKSNRGSPRNKFTDDVPPSLTEWVESLTRWAHEHDVPEGVKLPISRLAFLPEGGCKTRVIAIGDLFSQAIYLPLHDKLMKRLRSLPQDSTHDQSKAISWLKEKTQEGPVWSFDLTTATDRFPIKLQEIVMCTIFGTKVGVLWADTMSRLRDFSFKDSKGRIKDNIYYGKGQPMGLYSSWPAFAYTHHVFIRWCADTVGVRNFRDYRIIGDDIVIANESVANQYRSMLSLFEVPISKAKSIVSTRPPYSGEIAKRLIWKGEDVSPIPPELIKLVGKHVTMIPALIDEIESRYGLDSQTLSSLPSLAKIYSRRSSKEKALILLTAPAAFALASVSPLYGKTAHEVTSTIKQESIEPTVLGPWGTINPEVLMDIGWIQDQTRKVFILREYERVFKIWNFMNPSPEIEVPVIEVPGFRSRHHRIAIGSQHPIRVASTWLECKLQDLFQIRCSILGNEEEADVVSLGLQYCLDPSMRSYKDRKHERANIASHLTLEVFKVLSGRAPMSEIEHPDDGLLVAWVRLTAG